MANNSGIGYITIDGNEGLIRGALLVVDVRGIPLDFRYTDYIKPTKLERILYGNALDTYLKQELILQSLLDAVEVEPQLWICSDMNLLTPLKENGHVKAVLVSASTRQPLENVGSIESTSEPNVFYLQADGVSAPLRLVFAAGTRSDEIQNSAALLVEAAGTMEITEPFTRIQKALASLASGTEG